MLIIQILLGLIVLGLAVFIYDLEKIILPEIGSIRQFLEIIWKILRDTKENQNVISNILEKDYKEKYKKDPFEIK